MGEAKASSNSRAQLGRPAKPVRSSAFYTSSDNHNTWHTWQMNPERKHLWAGVSIIFDRVSASFHPVCVNYMWWCADCYRYRCWSGPALRTLTDVSEGKARACRPEQPASKPNHYTNPWHHTAVNMWCRNKCDTLQPRPPGKIQTLPFYLFYHLRRLHVNCRNLSVMLSYRLKY